MTIDSSNSMTGLRQNCLPFSEVLAQSIANIAPSVLPTLAIVPVFAIAGNGAWLIYVIATIGITFVSLNINQFASRSASPGSFYAYITLGLGPMAGVITGWSLLLAYLFTAMAVVCGFANYTEILLGAIGLKLPHLVEFAICIGIAGYLGYKDIRLSTMMMLVTEFISLALILLVGLIVFAHKGFTIDMAQLTLQDTAPGSIISGLVLGVFSYVGFESATTLGDEAKRPLRNIPRSVMWSAVGCGLFFVIMAYIEVLGFQGSATPLGQSAAPMNDLAQIAGVGFFGLLISLGAIISLFACTLASLNAGARVCFSMARHGIFARSLGQAHGQNETPHIAVAVSALTIFIVPALLSVAGVGLTDSFGYLGTIATYGFLAAYILIAVAAPLYLQRQQQLKPINIIYAVLAIIFMVVPVVGSIGIPGEGSLFPIPPFPFNIFPYLFLGYLSIGFVWLLILRSRSPHIISEMERDIEASHTRFEDMHKV